MFDGKETTDEVDAKTAEEEVKSVPAEAKERKEEANQEGKQVAASLLLEVVAHKVREGILSDEHDRKTHHLIIEMEHA